tara:strand:- start:1252 stop:1455 length:204 start_codon:yes stop_codon:yes gene_type:complete
MSTKGTAGKSASGAAMSKYDVEVEARLQSLEAKAHAKCDEGGGGDAARVEQLIAILKREFPAKFADL